MSAKRTSAHPEIVVMKFGGTSVEDAAAILRTANIVEGRVAKGLRPVVIVSAMAKVTDQLLACAAAALAGRGDREGAVEIAVRLRALVTPQQRAIFRAHTDATVLHQRNVLLHSLGLDGDR